MNITLLAFGIAKDILGYSSKTVSLVQDMSVEMLKKKLTEEHPKFIKLAKFDIAVNEEYRADDYRLSANDEVAIIPPVSGG